MHDTKHVGEEQYGTIAVRKPVVDVQILLFVRNLLVHAHLRPFWPGWVSTSKMRKRNSGEGPKVFWAVTHSFTQQCTCAWSSHGNRSFQLQILCSKSIDKFILVLSRAFGRPPVKWASALLRVRKQTQICPLKNSCPFVAASCFDYLPAECFKKFLAHSAMCKTIRGRVMGGGWYLKLVMTLASSHINESLSDIPGFAFLTFPTDFSHGWSWRNEVSAGWNISLDFEISRSQKKQSWWAHLMKFLWSLRTSLSFQEHLQPISHSRYLWQIGPSE